MTQKTVNMFPGQCVQRKGMGEDLLQRFPCQIKATKKILGYDLPHLCTYGSGDELDRTKFTQSALYLANAFHFYAHRGEGGPVWSA